MNWLAQSGQWEGIRRARLALFHRRPLIRDAVRALIENTGRAEVVATAGSAAIDMVARTLRPDVLVVMLDGDAAEDRASLRQLARLRLRAAIIAGDDADEDQIAAARRLGGCAVQRCATGDELVDFVCRVAGQTRPAMPLSRSPWRGWVQARTTRAGRLVPPLTPIEARLLSMIVRGLALSDIARQLRLTRAEAQACLIAVLDKFEVTDRVQLTAHIAAQGDGAAENRPA